MSVIYCITNAHASIVLNIIRGVTGVVMIVSHYHFAVSQLYMISRTYDTWSRYK